MKHLKDTELVTLYINGQNQAFGIMIDRHSTAVLRAILKYGIDTATADDIAQEAYIKAMNEIQAGKFKNDNFKAWLLRIAGNLAVDYHRKNKRSHTNLLQDELDIDEQDTNQPLTLIEILPTAYENPEEVTIFAIDYLQKYGKKLSTIHKTVERLIKTLPEEQQRIIHQRFFENIQFKEICKIDDLNINTALGRARYALINLRKAYERTRPTTKEILQLKREGIV